MRTITKLSAIALFVSVVGFATVVSAQYAPPPPPPPPPGDSPGYAPPPPPPTHYAPPPSPYVAPAPGRCGVSPAAPPCYRPRRYLPRSRPGFFRLGPYIGVGAGGFGIISAKGPFQYISPGAFGNVYIGMNFSPRFALELGFLGSAHQEQFAVYDATYSNYEQNSLLLWGVTLDAKLNLIRPSWRSRFVPYLQAGVGAYGLVGERMDEWGYEQAELATGAGLQLGGGIDIYLTRWLTLGARVLYRGIYLGKLQCSDTGERCVSRDDADKTWLNGLTGELNLAIVF